MKIKLTTTLTMLTIALFAQKTPSVAVLDFDTRGYDEVARHQIIQKLTLEMMVACLVPTGRLIIRPEQ